MSHPFPSVKSNLSPRKSSQLTLSVHYKNQKPKTHRSLSSLPNINGNSLQFSKTPFKYLIRNLLQVKLFSVNLNDILFKLSLMQSQKSHTAFELSSSKNKLHHNPGSLLNCQLEVNFKSAFVRIVFHMKIICQFSLGHQKILCGFSTQKRFGSKCME